jgi:hypothetical protein
MVNINIITKKTDKYVIPIQVTVNMYHGICKNLPQDQVNIISDIMQQHLSHKEQRISIYNAMRKYLNSLDAMDITFQDISQLSTISEFGETCSTN